ncbi:phosphate uptake regulator PhoU [Candidatus Woesearchaeota archaeon]|nr:phosphate uptake regulator PhoU [Candidatus Woesearchaeota archaeon]
MEERTIVKSGLASHTITIPKNWLQRNHLKKGSKVYCTEEESSLRIFPTKVEHLREEDQAINIDDAIDIQRQIVAAYLTNHNEIRIFGKTLSEKLTKVKEFVTKLAGLEILEETGNHLILKDYIDIDEINLWNLLKRMDIIIRSMMSDTRSCLEKTNPQLASVVYARDLELNKLAFLVYKNLNYLAMHPDQAALQQVKPHNLMHLWEMNNHLEKIGDEVKRLVISSGDLPPKNAESIKELFEFAENFYRKIMDAFRTKNQRVADEASNQRYRVLDMCAKYLETARAIKGRHLVARIPYIISHTNDISRTMQYIT